MTEPPRRKFTRLPAEDRRRQIAEAALACLKEDGPTGTTARRVALKAGVALGHITYHYKDMAEILAAAFALAAEAVQAAGKAELDRPGGTPTQRLERFLKAGFTPDLMTPAHLRLKIDLWSSALTLPALAVIERGLYDSHRRCVETLLDGMAADYAVGRIPAVADLVMATLDGLWLDWLRRGDAGAVQNGLDGAVLFARLRLGAS